MTTATTERQPELAGQTVVLIGGSAGMGLETARRARAGGADVILTGRNPGHLERAAAEIGARSSAAFDATDPAALGRFFGALPGQIDHVMVTAGRRRRARRAHHDQHGADWGDLRHRRRPATGPPPMIAAIWNCSLPPREARAR